MRCTVPPSAEIEARIDQLLAVGVGESPRETLSELARLIIRRAVEDEFDAWLGRARYERRPEYRRGLRKYDSGMRNGFRRTSGEIRLSAGSRSGSNSSASSICRTKGGFMESVLLDVAGHRRSPATMPGYHRGRPPRNKGEQYPADPPTVEEIVAVMRSVGDRSDAHRLRALIVLLWRAGLRISEALALQESDLDRSHGAVLVRRGKGGKRREVGMDRWAWDQLDPWLDIRRELPIGPCCA